MGTARTPRRCQDYADSLIQLLRSGIESKGSSGGDDAPSVWTLQRIAWQKVKSRQISSNFTNHDVRDTRSKWHLASVVARVHVNVHFIRRIYTAMALAAGAHRLTRPLWHRHMMRVTCVIWLMRPHRARAASATGGRGGGMCAMALRCLWHAKSARRHPSENDGRPGVRVGVANDEFPNVIARMWGNALCEN